MRLKLTLLLTAIAALSGAQAWEKRIAPGLTYREEVDRATPRVVHVLRWNLGTPVVRATAELGAGVVFDQTPEKGRETISSMVNRTHAVAGINADFFQVPYTGDPLGLMVTAGQLISVPIVQRSVLAWDGDKPKMGVATWKGDVTLASNATIELDGINELASNDRLVLNTEVVGVALGKAPDVAWVIKLDAGTWTPEGSRTGEIVEVVRDLAARKVTPGLAVVIGTGAKAHLMEGVKIGDKVKLSNHAAGFDWNTVKFAIGGGPNLVKNGKAAVDWKEQRFKDSFALARHPRSAVGITAAGDICLVAVDGRQPGISDGVTLDELAQIMLRQGCTEAMNLDGGGSTCLDIHGLSVNRPSDGKERPVANAILLFEEKPPADASALKPDRFSINSPPKVFAEQDAQFSARDAEGAIDNAAILWSARGPAWIDQGGTLHPLDVGQCVVTAWSNGRSESYTVDILEKPEPPVKAKAKPKKKKKPVLTTEHEDGQ